MYIDVWNEIKSDAAIVSEKFEFSKKVIPKIYLIPIFPLLNLGQPKFHKTD